MSLKSRRRARKRNRIARDLEQRILYSSPWTVIQSNDIVIYNTLAAETLEKLILDLTEPCNLWLDPPKKADPQ